MKIDTHIHHWKRSDGDPVGIIDKIGAMNHDYTCDRWSELATPCGVTHCILVQSTRTQVETLRCLGLAGARDDIVGVVGWVDLSASDPGRHLDTLRQAGPLKGIRAMPKDPLDPQWTQETATLDALTEMERRGLTLDVVFRWQDLSVLPALADRFPALRIVLNHAGRPDTMCAGRDGWRSGLEKIARHENVFVKCGGLVERAGIEWTLATLRPYVVYLLQIFGPRRMMFASNWPLVELAATYADWHDAAVSIIQECCQMPGESEAFWSDTAIRAYDLREMTIA